MVDDVDFAKARAFLDDYLAQSEDITGEYRALSTFDKLREIGGRYFRLADAWQETVVITEAAVGSL